MAASARTAIETMRDRWSGLVASFFGMLAIGALNHSFSIGWFDASFYTTGVVPILIIFTSLSCAVGFIGAHSLCEHYGYKGVVVVGALLMTATFFIAAFSEGNHLVAGLFPIIASCGLGLTFPIVFAVCSGWFAQKVSLAVGVMAAFFFIGGPMFGFLLYFLKTALGYAGGMFILGLLYSAFLFTSLYFLRRAPADNVMLALRYGTVEKTNYGRFARVWALLLLFTMAMFPFIMEAHAIWQSVTLSSITESLITGESVEQALAVGKTTSWLATTSPAMGSLLSGIAADRMDKRGLIILAAVVAIIAMIALRFTTGYYLFSFLIFSLGVCWGSVVGTLLAMITKIFRRGEMIRVTGLTMSAYACAVALVVGEVSVTPQRNITLPFEVSATGGLLSNTIKLINPNIFYIGSVVLCVIVIMLVYSWNDYDENRKKGRLIT